MSSEMMKILEMIQEGKLTAAEGMDLLKAVEEGNAQKESGQVYQSPVLLKKEAAGERFLRVRVVGEKSLKVNVNVPLSLIRSASKIVVYALSFVPADKREELEKKGLDLKDLDVEDLARILEESLDGRIVDIEVADPNEGKIKVEVYVE